MNETIWSLTSPRVRRIIGPRNFRSPPQKDFCNNFRLLTHGWDSQSRELKVWFESLTRRHPVPELSLPRFLFGRVRQVPHRALVNRAARRLGHPASIPRAIMSRSPEALAFGSRRHFIPASLSLPLCGCLLNRSRDCSRSRVRRGFPRRRDADAPAAASFCCLGFAPALFGDSTRRGGSLSSWAAFFVRK